MNSLLGLALVLLLQTTASAPIRIGTNADRLTENDLTELQALPDASNPWLLNAPRGQIGDIVQIFLPPTTATTNLRRGAAIIARRGRVSPAGKSWSVSTDKLAYAQVAVDGRSMDRLEKSGDIAQPFTVVGSFTDDEILSIVAIIRSRPTASLTNNIGRSGPVAGELPIVAIRRTFSYSVSVKLARSDFESQEVTLQLVGSTWTVISAIWGMA